ncbi:hypothetical protein FA15DRAFT_357076 [Coprinopsis marcescibilis]|uniref:BAH domain-containing protein n=1 Tax=Coprinopsis marcescibilis TaxID=230819 RepID=A0A5C3KXY1_COPMA|nr:hypothetical protein FA15DRAFT_357076 [Coprinopsis marcescibilis]
MPRLKGSKRSKGKSQKSGADEFSVPTEEQWEEMKTYSSFIVGEDNEFMRGQIATVLPNGHSPGSDIQQHEYWVGKIKGIRAFENAEDDTNDVWVKVQWYYDAKDVAGVIKSFDTKSTGKYERFLSSEHHDFVNPEAFNEIVTVTDLRDEDPEQPYIGNDQFYMRYAIERQARRLKPKPENTCICHKPYVPHDETTVMHFCPRPTCRKWFHQVCLINNKSAKSCSQQARGLRLLATSPDDEEPESLHDKIPMPPSKRTRRASLQYEKAAESDETDSAVSFALAAMPIRLVFVAQQPIVRGASYEKGGVSGNVKAVVAARRLVYNSLAGKGIPEDWEDMVLGQISPITLDDCLVKIKRKRVLPSLLCPDCHSAI